MARLEDLATGTRLTGLAASGSTAVESVQWIGEQALRVIFRDGEGQLSERLLYHDDEPSPELVEMGRPWSFDERNGGLIQAKLWDAAGYLRKNVDPSEFKHGVLGLDD